MYPVCKGQLQARRAQAQRLSLRASKQIRLQILNSLQDLPELIGRPIRVSTLPELSAHQGKLLSGRPEQGSQVYAGCFVRKREIVLARELLRDSEKFRFILVHEIFHFVWGRLSNDDRKRYAALLNVEIENRARGELGESAGAKKSLLRSAEAASKRRLWRDYVCESFCDTAAWLYSDPGNQLTFVLAKRWRQRRKLWFENLAEAGFRC